MADYLSKEALTLAQGQLQFAEFTNGECIDQGTFYLFQPSTLDLSVLLSFGHPLDAGSDEFFLYYSCFCFFGLAIQLQYELSM